MQEAPDEPSDAARGVEEFYQLDLAKGELTNRRTKRRMLAQSTTSWYTLKTALRRAFGPGAAGYMHQIGYAVGVAFARDLRTEDAGPLDIMTILPAAGRAAGWGNPSLKGEVERGTDVTVTVENCPSCGDEQEGTPPLCDMLVGILNGVADEVYGKPHSVAESKCGFRSDRRCEFRVSEVAEPTDEQKHWASYVIFPWLAGK